MVTEVFEETKAIVTTVSINVNPTIDPAYEAVKKEIELYAQCVENAVINTPEAVQKITADVNLGAKLDKQIEQLRLSYKADITKYGKQIDAAFKPLSEPIAEARKVAAQKIKGFNDKKREEQRLIDEENARIAREAAELQALIDEENAKLAAERTIDEETGEIQGETLIPDEPKPAYIPDAPVIEKATTDFGSANEKMVGKYKLVDIKKVPANLILLNEKAVNAMLKAGVREIEGLEIWEEPEVSFRSK